MKAFRKIIAHAVALVTLGAACDSKADKNLIYLSPKNTSFHLTGSFSLFNNTQPIECKITLSGVTSGGGNKLHAGSITGASAQGSGCKHIVFSDFPYTIGLENQKTGIIGPIQYTLGGNTCATGGDLTISPRGIWTFSGQNACGIGGVAKSSPEITVQKGAN